VPEPITLLDWIERLGGWGVVLLVVRWMMSRIDADRREHRETTRELVGSMQAALDQFARFESEEHDTHDRIVATQREILVELLRLRKKEDSA
jgi:hypothetical protein